MATFDVQEFMNSLSDEQRKKVTACKTNEELAAVIAAENIDITPFAHADEGEAELSLEDIQDVTGGKGFLQAFLASAIMFTSTGATLASAMPAYASYEPNSAVVSVTKGVRYGEDGHQGNEALNDYLKSIRPADKKQVLIQKGEGATLDTKNTAQKEGTDFVVVTRKLESLENSNADLATLEGTAGGIYPGIVVHADENLVDGCPNILPIEDTNRQPLPLYLDISGNKLPAQTVDTVSYGSVNAKINEMLDTWFEGKRQIAARATYKCVMVHSEKQVDLALGVEGAAKKYGVDAKACMEGKKQEMLVIFNQIYYTVQTPQTTAAGLFADNVQPEDFIKAGVDADNPCLAEVTRMSYGRQIIVKFETSSSSADVETAWHAAVSATKIEGQAKYKEIMENTAYSVCAYGGSATAVDKIMKNSTLSEVNDALAADLQFTADTPAVPLGYSTNFIDDASNATVNRTTKYVATTRQVRKPITYEVDAAALWIEKHQRLLGKKIIGIDEDGNYQLSGWIDLSHDKGNVKKTNIPGEFVVFGFEVDVRAGTDWPYSDVFWTASKDVVKSIKIDTSGTVRMPDITIKVNGNEVFSQTNCDAHDQYDWGTVGKLEY